MQLFHFVISYSSNVHIKTCYVDIHRVLCACDSGIYYGSGIRESSVLSNAVTSRGAGLRSFSRWVLWQLHLPGRNSSGAPAWGVGVRLASARLGSSQVSPSHSPTQSTLPSSVVPKVPLVPRPASPLRPLIPFICFLSKT